MAGGGKDGPEVRGVLLRRVEEARVVTVCVRGGGGWLWRVWLGRWRRGRRAA